MGGTCQVRLRLPRLQRSLLAKHALLVATPSSSPQNYPQYDRSMALSTTSKRGRRTTGVTGRMHGITE